jgi:hypothetical protein
MRESEVGRKRRSFLHDACACRAPADGVESWAKVALSPVSKTVAYADRRKPFQVRIWRSCSSPAL